MQNFCGLVFTIFSIRSAGTGSFGIMALDRVCQNVNPFF